MKTIYCNIPAHREYWTAGYVMSNVLRTRFDLKGHVTHNSSAHYLLRTMRLTINL